MQNAGHTDRLAFQANLTFLVFIVLPLFMFVQCGRRGIWFATYTGKRECLMFVIGLPPSSIADKSLHFVKDYNIVIKLQ